MFTDFGRKKSFAPMLTTTTPAGSVAKFQVGLLVVQSIRSYELFRLEIVAPLREMF